MDPNTPSDGDPSIQRFVIGDSSSSPPKTQLLLPNTRLDLTISGIPVAEHLNPSPTPQPLDIPSQNVPQVDTEDSKSSPRRRSPRFFRTHSSERSTDQAGVRKFNIPTNAPNDYIVKFRPGFEFSVGKLLEMQVADIKNLNLPPDDEQTVKAARRMLRNRAFLAKSRQNKSSTPTASVCATPISSSISEEDDYDSSSSTSTHSNKKARSSSQVADSHQAESATKRAHLNNSDSAERDRTEKMQRFYSMNKVLKNNGTKSADNSPRSSISAPHDPTTHAAALQRRHSASYNDHYQTILRQQNDTLMQTFSSLGLRSPPPLGSNAGVPVGAFGTQMHPHSYAQPAFPPMDPYMWNDSAAYSQNAPGAFSQQQTQPHQYYFQPPPQAQPAAQMQHNQMLHAHNRPNLPMLHLESVQYAPRAGSSSSATRYYDSSSGRSGRDEYASSDTSTPTTARTPFSDESLDMSTIASQSAPSSHAIGATPFPTGVIYDSQLPQTMTDLLGPSPDYMPMNQPQYWPGRPSPM